jgi:hypothetical protein
LELSKPAAESEVAYAPQGGGIAGFFGCDVDEDDFQAMNRIRIYPGQTNNWIIGKRASSTDPVKETIEDMLDPINTSSWYNPGTWVKMPIAIAPSPSAEHVREEVAVEGLSVQKRRDDLTHVPNLGPNIVYYNVSFNAPKDAPPEIPWPVVGCVEEADWTVLWQLTSKAVAPIDTATPGSPTSQAAIEKAQQEAQQALLTGGSLPGMTDPMGGKQLDPKLIWVGAALAIGLVVLHRRQQEAQK